MIIKSTGFQCGSGQFHPTLEAAQKSELVAMFTDPASEATWTPEEVANLLLDQKDKIVDILTTTNGSKPRARKVNGGTKTRKKHIAPQAQLPLEEPASK